MIEIKANQQDLADLLGKLEALPKGLATATSRAINKSLTSVRAEMVRLIRADYDLKAGEIRKQLVLVKATPSRLEGRIAGESSPGVPLLQFVRMKRVPSTLRTKGGAYTPKVGIPVLIRRDKGKLVFKRAFLARMGSGHVGAFVRTVQTLKASGRGRRESKMGKRYVKELYGPSPIKLMGSNANQERIEDFAQEVMDKNLRHEAEFFLIQAGI
jgi:hypothetical protein